MIKPFSIGKFAVVLSVIAVAVLSSCSKDDDLPQMEGIDEYFGGSGGGGSSSSSIAPSSIANKTLTFYKDAVGTTVYFSAEHYSSGGVTLSISSTDYAKYPPSYTYKRGAGNSAVYELSFTTKTYIPLYASYTYAKFRYEMTLSFTNSREGTYKANYYNVNGLYKTLTGKFTLK